METEAEKTKSGPFGPAKTVITRDSVTLSIDGVLYVKVEDPHACRWLRTPSYRFQQCSNAPETYG